MSDADLLAAGEETGLLAYIVCESICGHSMRVRQVSAHFFDIMYRTCAHNEQQVCESAFLILRSRGAGSGHSMDKFVKCKWRRSFILRHENAISLGIGESSNHL